MKKARVIWTDESLGDLETIHDFLAEKSLKAAKKAVQSILQRTRQLEAFPESGSPQEIENTASRPLRYLIEGHYKIVYSLGVNAL